MILAIDLGSTNFKAAVFDEQLTLLGDGSSPLEYRFAAGGCVELAAPHVVDAFDDAVRQAVGRAGIAAEKISCVAITSQAQTFTVVDSRGRPKMPFISWQDTRAGEACRLLAAGLAEFDRHAGFGELIDALQICQLAHIRRTQPGFIKPGDTVLHLPTFFVRRLIGRAVIDRNLAAMSGLYSLSEGDWWAPAIEACGLGVAQLPSLVEIGAVAGVTCDPPRGDAESGFLLPVGIPVVLAGNDQTAGAYGASLEAGLERGRRGSLLLTLGTAQVAYACGKERAEPSSAVVCGPYPDGLHYRLAADGCGGSIVNWAKTVLADCGSDAEFFAKVEEAPKGCRGLVFDADLPGENGAWRNLALCHGTAEMARAIIESLSRRMADMVDALVGVDGIAGVNGLVGADGNLSEMSVLAAGGGSRSRAWVAILAETLGCTIETTDADPLRGAARMGLGERTDGRGQRTEL